MARQHPRGRSADGGYLVGGIHKSRHIGHHLRLLDKQMGGPMADAATARVEAGDSDGNSLGAEGPESSQAVLERFHRQVDDLVQWVDERGNRSGLFTAFEVALIPRVFAVARTLVQLFLVLREQRLSEKLSRKQRVRGNWYTAQSPKRRQLRCFFGKVPFWRRYYSRDGGGAGFHPLDKDVGLTTDGFSLSVMSLACRLATQMPYEAAAKLMTLFIGEGPSHTTIEHMVLGLGAHARAYMEQALPSSGDGEVLVIQIDNKCAPTARASELRKRRGKRALNPHPESARHRGRSKRRRAGPKKRRKKGDKSKNGRAATVVVMYTLRRSADGLLLGPLNKKQYASFAGKRYGFAWARAMAERRGFSPASGKQVQFVSDGDPDFRVYLGECFQGYGDQLVLTLDLPHVMEYVWKAGTALHREGSDKLSAWAQKQKRNLLLSRGDLVVRQLKKIKANVPKTGPGNKSKRKRLSDAIDYIHNNLDRMDYKYLRDQDLELASGACEGAVNYVIGLRFDHGGMRWLVERAEALLQLRCIELNGEWDDFLKWLQQSLQTRSKRAIGVPRLFRDKPIQLPTINTIDLAA
jgi:hypothetical protein